MFNDLTTRQREVLEYIRANIKNVGYPPSFREIAAHFGFCAYTNGVNCHLKALEKKGYITRERMAARGIRLTEAAKATDGIPVIDLSKVDRA